jgi:DNA-binding transcriptional LysR family regulator
VRVFLAVARTGQLTAAASRLGIDVSTVSRRIDRLEEQLGVHLFDRRREGTVATAAAEAMLPAAEDMERKLAEFAAAVDAVEATAEGVVRLSVPPGIATAFVAPALARFHERYPRVIVELDVGMAHVDLTRRDADLALRGSRPRSGDLIATRLTAAQLLPIASPAYAAALGRLGAWTDARWIGWGPEMAGLPGPRWLAAHAPDVVPVLRTSHLTTQLAAAAGGVGILLASEPFREAYGLAKVAIARRLQPAWDALPVEELWLVGHKALRTVPRIAALFEFLVENARR